MQRRLRPSQGGRFMRPVGPAPEVVAKIRAQDPGSAHLAGLWRQELMGHFVRDYIETVFPIVPEGEKASKYFTFEQGDFAIKAPAPEKPLETTFGALQVGERFVWICDTTKDKDIPRVKTPHGWLFNNEDHVDGYSFSKYLVRRVP